LRAIDNPAKVRSERLLGNGKATSDFELGEYRIILAIAPEEITFIRVRHRSEAYR
jgi:hypothetical protein